MKVSEYQDIGQYLHDSRESLHVTLDQAARDLHIRAKYLKAIESGQLAELPGKAYIRGYIRNYVEYLRLNPDEVLDAYEALYEHKGREFFIPEPTHRQNLPTQRNIGWSLLGIFVLYLVWYFTAHDGGSADFTVAEVPPQFMQLLDKTPRPAMDRAWERCLGDDNIRCFVMLHTRSLIPNNSELYDVDLTDNSPRQP